MGRRKFTDEEKKKIIADVQKQKSLGNTIQAALKDHTITDVVYYKWLKDFNIQTDSAKALNKRGRKIGSKNKKTTLIEMPMTPTFTAPTANVAMFFGSPESLKAIYADLMDGVA